MAAILRYATASGRLAMKYQANREARIQFSRVAPYAHLLPLPERAQMYQDYAKVSCITGNYEVSVELCTTAVELWRAAGRRARAADALVWLAQPCSYLGRDAAFWQAIDEAEELIEDTTLFVELEEAASRTDEADGDESALEAAADLRALLDTKVRVYQTRGEDSYPNVEDILYWARKCAECYQRYGHLRALASEHRLKAYALAATDRFRVALRESAKSLDIAKANDFDDIIGTGPLILAKSLGVELRFALALPLLVGVAEASRNWEADYLLNTAEGLLALAHLYLGDWVAAEENARPVLKRREATPVSLARVLIALGRLRVRRGEPGADEFLDEAALVIQKFGKGGLWSMLCAARAEAALAAGDPDLALHHASPDEASFDARPPATYNAELAYWRWKAGGAATRPQWSTGPFLWQMSGQPGRAATRWRRLQYPFEEAMALSDCGDAASLTRAYDLFDRLGARPAAAAVAGKLRGAGAPVPRAHAAVTPASLTPRERQVLELMSQGLRNADIAKVNRVSPRTIDHQVSAVLSKLGARTRTEAVSLAGSLGILPSTSEGRLQT
ncbi:MAG TPA: helix-turn-helix transcriptional regulator [Trueperaceae bacterium]